MFFPFQANLNSDNIRLMSAMLCAALYPNVVQVCINPVYKLASVSYSHDDDVSCLLSLLASHCI